MPLAMPVLLAAALLAAASTVHAAPFAITYTGTVAAGPSLAGVNAGERYSVTFILDNGGATAAGQRWLLSDLRCTLWRFGQGSQRTTFRQALTGSAGELAYGSGSVRANAAGTALVDMIHAGISVIPPANYTVSGPITLSGHVTWNVYDDEDATAFNVHEQGSFTDILGGVPTDPARWGRPVAVAGSCDDTPLAPGPGQATAVPALGAPALALLGLAAAGLGARRLRRKS